MPENAGVRPRLVTFNIASLDGRIGFPDRLLLHGDPRWDAISRRAGVTLADMEALHAPEAMLGGSNSLVPAGAPPLDLPAPATRADLHRDFVPDQRSRWFVVVDSRGRVRWTYREMGGWHLLVLVARATPAAYLAYLREEGIPYLVAGEARVDLAGALEGLSRRGGVQTVVADGGGRLNGALLRAGLVDEVDVQFLPAIIGAPDAPSLFSGFGLGDDDAPVQLTPIALENQGHGFFFVRYAVAGDR
jgi:2,5-diamino-6-(ribosylamino)-4(3H)-pyrimidinone 5'-phosphate reductase